MKQSIIKRALRRFGFIHTSDMIVERRTGGEDFTRIDAAAALDNGFRNGVPQQMWVRTSGPGDRDLVIQFTFRHGNAA